MGPGFRRDDEFKANTFKTVIPAHAGTHNPLAFVTNYGLATTGTKFKS